MAAHSAVCWVVLKAVSKADYKGVYKIGKMNVDDSV